MTSTAEANKPTVEYDGKSYELVKEGLAEILNQRQHASNKGDQPQTVFYNPIQQFNRDLSVLAIRVFGDDYIAKRKLKDDESSTGESKRARKRKRPEDGWPESAVDNSLNTDQNVHPANFGTIEGSPTEIHLEAYNNLGTTTQKSYDHSNLESSSKVHTTHFTLRILDALSASGLRALRYAKELPQRVTVTANDLSPAATQSIALNVRYNALEDRIFPMSGHAQAHMYRVASEHMLPLPDGSHGKYHVIDIDPYGTAAPFLDSAVQATVNGGLLCVTCTDAGVFASAGYLEKTYSQYGGLPLRGPHAHEGGLRLILHAIAMAAARYGIAIEPMLSLSIDFYARLFVRVRRSPSEVKLLAGKTMAVYNCDAGCGAWTTQSIARTGTRENKVGETMFKFQLGQAPSSEPHCQHCGFKTHLAGPMWGGPLHNPFFIQRILDLLPSLDSNVYQTIPRIEGMLSTARDETLLPEVEMDRASGQLHPNGLSTSYVRTGREADEPIPRLPPHLLDPHPFFILPSSLAKVLHCTAPSVAALRGALVGLGFRTTRSHTKPGSIKTDAPWSILWEVMREWSRQHAPVKDEVYREGTSGRGIMRWSRVEGTAKFRRELKNIAEKPGHKDDLRKEIEALLWRLGSDGKPDNEMNIKNADKVSGSDCISDTATGCSNLTVIFDEKKGKEPGERKLMRYQINPQPNWGPRTRAKGSNA